MKRNPEVRQFIAARIRELRLAFPMTQERLSELTDIDVGTLSRYERGVLEPSPEALYAIACALKCQCGDFFPPSTVTAALVAFPPWIPLLADLLPLVA